MELDSDLMATPEAMARASSFRQREELLDRARALTPKLKERAFKAEALRRLPDETVADLLGSRLNRIAVPLRFGGTDVEFDVMHDVAIELGRGCGASAWCYALWGVHNWWVGYFPSEAQEEMYANGPDVLTSSAGFSLNATAEPVKGGYRVSGRWQFSSGCDHADWIFPVVRNSDGPIRMIVPRSDFRVLDDTWHVSGMQGTGSKDVVINDAFVPFHRTHQTRGDQFSIGSSAPNGYHSQRRYLVPFGALVIWDLVAPAIGLAQGAIDEMVLRASTSTSRSRSADSPILQVRIAESAAEVDAAQALLHSDIADAQNKGERGEPITRLDLARYARDKAYAMKLAVNATNRMFDMAGGHALFLTDPMQRIHRDVQACMHRDGLVFDFGALPFARSLLGLDTEPSVKAT